MTRNSTDLKELIRFTLKLLARRDYFKAEIENKLKEKGASSEKMEHVLEYINKFGYIDDRKTLEKYIAEIIRKGKGVLYLKNKLYEKGCSGLYEDFNMDEIFTPFMEEEAAKKVCFVLKDKNPEIIRKKLISRGFSFATVAKVLKNMKEGLVYED